MGMKAVVGGMVAGKVVKTTKKQPADGICQHWKI